MAKNKLRYINIFYWWRKITFSSIFQNLWFIKKTNSRKAVFNSIYKSYHWKDYFKPGVGESYSGYGSDKHLNEDFISSLTDFIDENKIESVLDLACGDFNWMKQVIQKSKNIKKYLGYEIVDSITRSNKKLYANENIEFETVDIIENKLDKKFDLIVIKDLFQHIKNNEILSVLSKIKKNNSLFVCISTNPDISENVDLKNFGHHRYINVEIDPFNLKSPFMSFVANKNEKYLKKLNIYKLTDIK